MNSLYIISRILLGLTFTTFGLNGFYHFIKLPLYTGVAGRFMGALVESGYLIPVFALQLTAGGLLLANCFVPLALALLAPIVVNIALFHVLMDPRGLGKAVIAVALWAIVFCHERSVFVALLSPHRAIHI